MYHDDVQFCLIGGAKRGGFVINGSILISFYLTTVIFSFYINLHLTVMYAQRLERFSRQATLFLKPWAEKNKNSY